MHESKLLDLLKNLSSDEMRWLTKFVRSPFYNANKLIIKLFDYLRKYHPTFPEAKVDKEIVFKKLFPKEPYLANRMNVLIHRLGTLVEQFLVAMQLRAIPFDYQKLLTTALGHRNLYDLFEKETNNLLKQLQTRPYLDANYHLEVHLLNQQWFNHPNTFKESPFIPCLEDGMKHLDRFYFLRKLRLGCEYLTRSKIYNSTPNVLLLKEIETLIDGGFEKESLYFLLYRNLLHLFSTATVDDQLFQQTKNRLLELEKELNKEDFQFVLFALLNYTLFAHQKGSKGYIQKRFDLYKWGLAKELLFLNNQMKEITFSNIVNVGLVLEAHVWVEQFIVDYQQFIIAENRKNVVLFSQANLNFHQGDFEKAIAVLQKLDEADISYQFRAKTLAISAYFELFLQDFSYYGLLQSRLLAFEKFIRRNHNIASTILNSYLSFVLFLKKLTKKLSVFTTKHQDLHQLLKNLEQEKFIVRKSWLMEKIEALNKRGNTRLPL